MDRTPILSIRGVGHIESGTAGRQTATVRLVFEEREVDPITWIERHPRIGITTVLVRMCLIHQDVLSPGASQIRVLRGSDTVTSGIRPVRLLPSDEAGA